MALRTVAMVCAIFLASSTLAPAATHTAVVLFQPWSSGNLRHGFTVSATAKGKCWIRSLASERPDAWRCIAGDDIYDPCFTGSTHERTLACAQGPFSRAVTLLTIANPLTDNLKLTGELWGLRLRGAPWGLRLVNGDTCVFAQGATDAVAGERLNYACARSGWIVGVPDRSSAVWTGRSVDWPKHLQEKQIGIATAVF